MGYYYNPISWNAVSGADGYRILRSTDYGVTYDKYTDVIGTALNDGYDTDPFVTGNTVTPTCIRPALSVFDLAVTGNLIAAAIDNTPIGNTTPTTGKFTYLYCDNILALPPGDHLHFSQGVHCDNNLYVEAGGATIHTIAVHSTYIYADHIGEHDSTHGILLDNVVKVTKTTGNTLIVDTNVLVVDATNNRVGIGTASPGVPLDVNGMIRSKYAAYVGGLSLKSLSDYEQQVYSTANLLLSAGGAANIYFQINSVTIASLLAAGNFGLGQTTFGTSAAKVLAIGNGTAPSTAPADAFQMYSKDIAAGEAAPHFMTEHGDIIKLYQQAHIANPTDLATCITAITSILTTLENSGQLATA